MSPIRVFWLGWVVGFVVSMVMLLTAGCGPEQAPMSPAPPVTPPVVVFPDAVNDDVREAELIKAGYYTGYMVGCMEHIRGHKGKEMERCKEAALEALTYFNQ